MIRKYIITNIPVVTNRNSDGTIRGILDAAIANTIVAWQTSSSTPATPTIKGVIDYEVNMYMSRLSEKQRIERKNEILKGDANFESKKESLRVATTSKSNKDNTRTTGILVVTSTKPTQGQIEDGSIVSFTTDAEIFTNDRLPYAYSKTTGLYTVYATNRPRVNPFPGKILDDTNLGEQYDNAFFTQAVNKDTSSDTLVKLADADFQNKNISRTLVYRLGYDTGCHIIDRTYEEYVVTEEGDPPENVFTATKTIDLSSYMPINTGETLTIGKYILLDNILCVLFFTDIGYPHDGSATDIDLTRMYNMHNGEAKIKGELLLINRLTWDIKKISKTMQTSNQQIRYNGFIDMIKDEETSKLIIAEMLEETSNTSLSYDTAKIFVAAADSPKTPKVDITKTTCDSWYAILNTMQSNPPKYHVIKDGTKTWNLSYPKLNISLYDVKIDSATQQMVLSLEATIYEDSKLITKKYDYDCYGGYINCMLYQDTFDTNYTLYIGRCYTAWLQIPFISDDYILQPAVRTLQWRADSTKYRNAILPGEISGFFGTEFSAIIPKTNDTEASLSLIADVPGDFGRARTFMKDDPIGSGLDTISGTHASTHVTLMALNDYTATATTNFVRDNSCFDVFTGGSNTTHWPAAITNKTQTLWCTGIHIHTTRFIIIQDTFKKLKVVFGGLKALQVTNYYYDNTSEIFQSHLMASMSENATTGVFISGNIDEDLYKDTELLLYKLEIGGNNFSARYVTSNPPDHRFPIDQHVSQYTAQVTRVDLLKLTAIGYYISQSLYIHQFDVFYYNVGGYLSWAMDREAYEYREIEEDNKKKTILYGWTADMPVNELYTDTAINVTRERYGAAVNCLQIY